MCLGARRGVYVHGVCLCVEAINACERSDWCIELNELHGVCVCGITACSYTYCSVSECMRVHVHRSLG